MESSSQDRNLPATERKLRKAKEDGQVARSRDLSHLAVLGVGAVALVALAPTMFGRLQMLVARQLSFDSSTVLHPDAMLSRMAEMSYTALLGCTLFAAIVGVAVILSNLAVGGWVQSTKPIMPDLSRLNPLSGFGKMFSKEKAADTAKILVIVAVLAAIAGTYLASSIEQVATLMMQPSVAALAQMNHWLMVGMGLMLLVVLVVAVIDVPLQRFLFASRMKMSHQEYKQEHKESEGSPHVKNKLRARQREISQGSRIEAVRGADFVVVNPTHYAVAIRYDEATMNAPQVVSSGADYVAMKMRDIAREHDVPILHAPVLARALYTHADVGQDIPKALYAAVAQVLAYVYRLKAALRGEARMPGEPPVPDVPPELDPLNTTAS